MLNDKKTCLSKQRTAMENMWRIDKANNLQSENRHMVLEKETKKHDATPLRILYMYSTFAIACIAKIF